MTQAQAVLANGHSSTRKQRDPASVLYKVEINILSEYSDHIRALMPPGFTTESKGKYKILYMACTVTLMDLITGFYRQFSHECIDFWCRPLNDAEYPKSPPPVPVVGVWLITGTVDLGDGEGARTHEITVETANVRTWPDPHDELHKDLGPQHEWLSLDNLHRVTS